jgi:undecaprenyl-diphosphatase
MISYLQAIVLGLAQGVTELFPISSLGHSVILPTLLGWNINQNADFFVVFLVATHLATAIVLFFFFWKDWVKIFQGFIRSIAFRKIKDDVYARLAWLIIIATIPAGLLGFVFQNKLAALFGSPKSAAIFLVVNGLVLFFADIIRKRKVPEAYISPDEKISKVSWTKSFFIGCAQILALIPGFSRTGTTLSGGLFAGLDRESAARFAFLLATPIIFAAAFLKLPDLFHGGYPVGATFVGALCAAVGAYFSVKFLTKYFKTKTLKPFACYCVIAGIISFIVLFVR